MGSRSGGIFPGASCPVGSCPRTDKGQNPDIKRFVAKCSISIFVNLIYLRLKLLKCKANTMKINYVILLIITLKEYIDML